MSNLTIDIRCYCHGLGDCMLLKLPKPDGTPFRMLIDCGIHSAASGGAAKMRDIAADILKETEGWLDVLVITHEHWDHLSGFLQAADLFAGLKVGEVWFSWAEDPNDADGRKLDRFKADAASTLASSALRLNAAPGMSEMARGLNSLLGFIFGLEGEKVRMAREAARKMSSVVRHLEPGRLAPLPQVPGIRVYVLGPPRDPKLLGTEDILSETYAIGPSALSVAPIANGLSLNEGTLSIDDDPAAPFDGTVGSSLSAMRQGVWPEDPAAASLFWGCYFGPAKVSRADGDQAWRRIDYDWLASSVDLALQLDSRTNNTSLVLAFEFVETGRVLLFAADAQIGNWLSWEKVNFPADGNRPAKTADDLLRRTVFYKVGHHGSRNATRAAALEKMDHSALVAFSPTDEDLAGKVRWKDFPAPKTSQRLRELTSGRFIQSDSKWIHNPEVDIPVAKGGALQFGVLRGKAGNVGYVDLQLA
ncbi:hypothetical protein FB009_1263 [Sinorhizobium medicae]|uniref:MBL fold metallo-hydrolase n=1 Tax=Sinorhizobium medicae TaxID=110321 RepID=UPI00119A42E9|nr:MBL fold metallo-hydrolase [Sinorhizobium medicae]MDX0439617.1 hypothetical protein [Sinorhizobium medicae]MDX0913446.1 hypothetical protein [Sinorhizobium medicae]MDX1091489.1 hypothetical protein [Sinorhizobium medicae]MDX1116242.1 hypothetical protein [Sinorhizobium medicae]MQU73988.1 hypothetical protein [Sinorhizobium medicae]